MKLVLVIVTDASNLVNRSSQGMDLKSMSLGVIRDAIFYAGREVISALINEISIFAL